MNALMSGLRGLSASVASCHDPSSLDFGSEACNAILAAAGLMTVQGPSGMTTTVQGPGVVNPLNVVGVTTGPHYDIPGTNAVLPATSPNAPAAWPPNSVAVIQSYGYKCIPTDWPQPLDGSFPYCAAGQNPLTAAFAPTPVTPAPSTPALPAPSAPSTPVTPVSSAASTTPPQTQAQATAAAQTQGNTSANTTTAPPAAPSGAALSATLQNSTRPGNNTQLLVGDVWVITVTGAPNSPVEVTAVQNGNALGTTPMGTTNAQGVLTLSGTVAASSAGTWVEQWKVGGQPAGTVQFSVSAPSSGDGSGGGTGTGAGTSTDTGGTDTTSDSVSSFFAALTPTELLIGAGAIAYLLFSSKKGKH